MDFERYSNHLCDVVLKLPFLSDYLLQDDYNIFEGCFEISTAGSRMHRMLMYDYTYVYIYIWLVASTPLTNISQLGLLFPIYGKS